MNDKNDFEMMLHMVKVCSEVGNISDCNCHYQAGLYRGIKRTEKPIEELTVGELLKIHRSYTQSFNEMFRVAS